MAALQAEDADGVLIDHMSDITLTVADSGVADGLLSEETEMLILNKGKRPASTSSLADWLEKTRASHSCINTLPAMAPSTVNFNFTI